jgi:hypothetical protein
MIISIQKIWLMIVFMFYKMFMGGVIAQNLVLPLKAIQEWMHVCVYKPKTIIRWKWITWEISLWWLGLFILVFRQNKMMVEHAVAKDKEMGFKPLV